MQELSKIVAGSNSRTQTVTHDTAQRIRRRIIKDTMRQGVFGSMLLDIELEFLTIDSLKYIAALMIRQKDHPNTLRWYLKLIKDNTEVTQYVTDTLVDQSKTEDLKTLKLKDFKHLFNIA